MVTLPPAVVAKVPAPTTRLANGVAPEGSRSTVPNLTPLAAGTVNGVFPTEL